MRESVKLARLPKGSPLLQVVIDTEEEFDWDKGFDRNNTCVDSIGYQERALDLFLPYGLKPTYVVTYPVASNPSSNRVLREFLATGSCQIGAHLHPWVTPPFDEEITINNSYPGNLAPSLEHRKLAVLTDAIRGHLGITPAVYKAGRYGIGPSTASTLRSLGYLIDVSVVPFTNYSADGGPDFRRFPDRLCWVGCKESLLEIPLTRGYLGLLEHVAPYSVNNRLFDAVESSVGRKMKFGGVLARSRLLERATLTPEGVEFGAQRRLLNRLLERQHRLFTLTFHSPSLAPGNTPYVRDRSDLQRFLGTIADLLAFFFEELGGHPIWPMEVRDLAMQQIARDLPVSGEHA